MVFPIVRLHSTYDEQLVLKMTVAVTNTRAVLFLYLLHELSNIGIVSH
ncbi:hypothetical protein VDIAB_220142 [Vibrio diabolicus]|nr:hypothetical protein VDIAB_220142 [Vibrio diabolicus]